MIRMLHCVNTRTRDKVAKLIGRHPFPSVRSVRTCLLDLLLATDDATGLYSPVGGDVDARSPGAPPVSYTHLTLPTKRIV